MPILDFDRIDEWAPSLRKVLLSATVPAEISEIMTAHRPKFIEDALKQLFKVCNRDLVIDATIEWINSNELAGYHGTRVSAEDLEPIKSLGLIPLKGEDRIARLSRALAIHPRWLEIQPKLADAIQAIGPHQQAGGRLGQVHLTLSRSGLVSSFNHYLTYGAEFDQHVVQWLLDTDALDLLERDGTATVLQFAVPGKIALAAAHPYFTISDMREKGDVPNIVREFLEAWSFKAAYPDFQSKSLHIDCGIVFRAAVPPSWIVRAEALAI